MIIIDGYNLLHASGVFGDARGPLGFEQSRRALLDHLLELLGAEAEQTIVVFDAADAPDGLPARYLTRIYSSVVCTGISRCRYAHRGNGRGGITIRPGCRVE